MSDLALGWVVAVIAAVPVSLMVLALADAAGLEREGRRRRLVRLALLAISVPAGAWLAMASWGWAGAAHLEPLCQTYATPEFRAVRPAPPGDILLAIEPAAPLPPWTRAFGARLVTDPASPSAAAAPLLLEARSIVHHRNLWFAVGMERFRLIERRWGGVLAEGDELWVTAGRARYRCGIFSGPYAVRADRSPWPGGDAVRRFVERGLQPAPRKP